MSDSPIPLSVPCLEGNTYRYLAECVATNFVSSVGPFVGRFEERFAAGIGSPHAAACASGTAAIHLALCALGVGPGDEVLVSDFSFIATANPVTYVGARPVLVDANAATWNMDPDLVLEEIASRRQSSSPLPRAVLVAHVLGMPADLAPLKDVCRESGILLVEDAAEALGSLYAEGALAGLQVGAIGDAGCFSFNGNKVITTGAGGMVVSRDADLVRRVRHLSTQARMPGFDGFHDAVGYNYRMSNVHAAIGLAQIEQLPRFLDRKRAIARRYDEALRPVAGVTVPPRPAWAVPSMWLYSILIDPSVTGVDRRGAQARLAERGIDTRPVWAPSHLMTFYRSAKRLGGTVGEFLFERGLSLPCSVSLTAAEQDRVIEELLRALTRS